MIHSYLSVWKLKQIPKDLELLIVIAILTAALFVIATVLILADIVLFPPSLVKTNKDDSRDPVSHNVLINIHV